MVRIVRRLGLGVVAAVVVGVVCGGVARILMRLMVVAADQEATFSVAGTVAIMAVFAVFALPGTVLAAATRRRGRSALLVLGGLALCVPTTGIADTDLTAAGHFSGFEIVYLGGAVIGVYLTCLAIPVVGLAAVRLLDRPRADDPDLHPSADPSLVPG